MKNNYLADHLKKFNLSFLDNREKTENTTFIDQDFEQNDTEIIDNWETDISELNIFFEKATIPDTIKLNSFTSISNVPKFIQSHITTIEANKGNPTFRPYLDRLIELKNLL